MSTAKAASKKRKRDSNPEAHFELSESSTAKVGPLLGTQSKLVQGWLSHIFFFLILLVSYPALQAPLSTPFQCYSRKRSKRTAGKDGEEDEEIFVAGETDSVEFVTNEEETRKAAEAGCRYVS